MNPCRDLDVSSLETLIDIPLSNVAFNVSLCPYNLGRRRGDACGLLPGPGLQSLSIPHDSGAQGEAVQAETRLESTLFQLF